MTELAITVWGRPAPQGSKRAFVNRYTGRASMVESSKNVKPWREAVKQAVFDADGDSVITGPVVLNVTFTLPKPKSAPKTRRTWPDRKPDIDKLCRSTIDALTDAGCWEDDGRIVECRAAKRYPGEGPDALPRPGARIVIRSAEGVP